jgi:hypothetical protein
MQRRWRQPDIFSRARPSTVTVRNSRTRDKSLPVPSSGVTSWIRRYGHHYCGVMTSFAAESRLTDRGPSNGDPQSGRVGSIGCRAQATKKTGANLFAGIRPFSCALWTRFRRRVDPRAGALTGTVAFAGHHDSAVPRAKLSALEGV